MKQYKIYMINPEYMNRLREVDEHVPQLGDDSYHWRPFIGSVMNEDGYEWLIDFSSYKPQKEYIYDMGKLFTFKMMDNQYSNVTLSTVNLRYMVPVPECAIAEVDLDDLQMARRFLTYTDQIKFKRVLKKQLDSANKQARYINEAAKNLYARTIVFPEDDLSKICLRYKDLSDVCKEWDKEHTIDKNINYERLDQFDADPFFIGEEEKKCTKRRR